MARQIVEQVCNPVHRRGRIGNNGGSHAGGSTMGAGASEVHFLDGNTGELAHHVGTAHKRVCVFGHHHMIGEAKKQCWSRYRWSGNGHHRRDNSGTGTQRFRGLAPTVQCGKSFADVSTG